MSVRSTKNLTINARNLETGNLGKRNIDNRTPWKRNPCWLALPSVGGSEQKFVGLYQVWPDSNFIAVNCAGNYTVNWGDGLTENFSTGVAAYHEHSFSDSDLANSDGPVTFTDTGDTVNRTGHGYSNGDTISFATIVSTTGITAGQIYYVINSTTDNFQLATTINGSPISLTTNGSGTILPYKQAIVTITPQAGQNLTTINLNVKHNQSGLQQYSTGWLDIEFGSPNLTSLSITSATSPNVIHANLEKVTIRNLGSVTNLSNLFRLCYNLRSVPLFDTSSVTNMTLMFYRCYNLMEVPALNLSSVTTTTQMFEDCVNLIALPNFNTPNLTTCNGMFTSCTSLVEAPYFNTGSCTTFANLFSTCSSLQKVPLYDTTNVTTFASAFSTCLSLEEIPKFNTANVTSFSLTFSNCRSLRQIPQLDYSSCTNLSSTFLNCHNIKEFPDFNTTASLTSANATFQSCVSIRKAPNFNTLSGITSLLNMFNGCQSLVSVPAYDTSSATDMTSMFTNCYSLTDVGRIDTSAVTTMNSAFSGCTSLTTLPLINTGSTTNTVSMFSGCSALASIPSFNTSLVTNASSMFLNCPNLKEIPALNLSGISSSANATNIFANDASIFRNLSTGMRFSFSVAGHRLSKSALETVFDNLGASDGGTQTLTITNNWGIDTAVTKTVNTTAQSATISMANTSGLETGMYITGIGTGITTGISVTSDITADTLTLNNHGLVNGELVAFTGLGTTTGVSLRTIYYVVNATTNTFKISLTNNGAAINLTGSNATMTLRYPSYISAITTNVSITLDSPAATTQTNTTLTFRKLDASKAQLKGWAITY
jgi:surface protein